MNVEFPNLDIRYLPPYSPFLNPMENCFSVLKSAIKRDLQGDAGTDNRVAAWALRVSLIAFREGLLQQAIEVAVPQVTRQVTQNNYAHAQTYLVRCVQNEDIHW